MRLSNKFLATVLVVVGLATYALSFGNGLFWDDDDFILHNAYIQDTQYLPKLFSENVIAGSGLVSNYWRPVLLLVFSAEWHAWGDWAPGWHMVNALFHVTNGVLLFWILLRILPVIARNESSSDVAIYSGNLWGLLRRLQGQSPRNDRGEGEIAASPPAGGLLAMTGGGKWMAFFVALVFLVHPVQVEAVAYANSLGDSLSVFFMFLGVLCLERFLDLRRTNRTYKTYMMLGVSVICYPLALMSKETAIVMPGLLVLVALQDYKTHKSYQTYKTYRTHISRLLRNLWPFAVIALTYLALRATTLNFKNSFNLYGQSNVFTDNLWVRLLTFCKIIVEYSKLIFWPANLHMERSLAFATSFFDGQVILGLVMIIGLLTTAWWFWRRNFLISFGIFWFFVALVPTSNILVPINGLLYEHWLYVPIAGLAVALVGLVSFMADRSHKSYRSNRTYMTYAIAVIGTLVVVGMILRTVTRIQDWREPVTFYKQTLQFVPKDYKILNNLGMVLANRGDLPESIGYYNLAIAEDSSNPVAYHNLANTYAGLGNLPLAIEFYKKALEQDPEFLYSYGKLIQVYSLLGKWELALGVVDRYERQVGKTEELEQARQALRRGQELGRNK